MFESFLVRKFKIWAFSSSAMDTMLTCSACSGSFCSRTQTKLLGCRPFLFHFHFFCFLTWKFFCLGSFTFRSLWKMDIRGWTCSFWENIFCSWGIKTISFVVWALRIPPSWDLWRFLKVFSWNDAFRTPLSNEIFNFWFSLASPLLFFLLLFDHDVPPRGEPVEENAPIRGFERFSLNTTLLLQSDVLMTRFSLGTNWSILLRGKV